MVYIVDTHALVWFFEKSDELGRAAQNILASQDARLIIPTIIIAELFYLSQRKKVSPSFKDIFQTIERDKRCVIYPLDINVLRFLPEKMDIHDGIICGTALVYKDLLKEDVKLITKDEEIVGSGIIETIW